MDIPIDGGTAEPTHPTLAVMLKAPANAKRRLADEVGDLAAQAAERLLDCVLEDALAWPGPVCLSPADPRDREWLVSESNATRVTESAFLRAAVTDDDTTEKFSTRHGGPFELVDQEGGNLGERINCVDSGLRRRGAASLLFVGTDCPALDDTYLEQAAAALHVADAVLGPARDGGVVLMGARRPWPDLRGLRWSTPWLYQELRDLCSEAGWSVEELDVRRDIDNLRDLLDAGAALEGDERPSRRALAEWLSANLGLLLARHAETGNEPVRDGTP